MSDPPRKHFNPRWKKKKIQKNDKLKKGNSAVLNTIDDVKSNADSNTDDQCSLDKSPKSKSPKHRIAKRETPYPGWHFYFENEEYRKTSPIVAKIQAMEKFLEENPELIVHCVEENTFSIDVNLLYASQIFIEDWPDFKSELKNKPDYVLSCLGLAVQKIKLDHLKQQSNIVDVEAADAYVNIKILNYDPVVALKSIKVNYYGKFITVRGCIIRVNRSCQLASSLVLLCVTCRLPYQVKQKNGIYTPKKKCDCCGARKFEPELSSPYVETIPMQIVRIQEHFGEEQDDQGRVPRVMDVELYEDMVDTCMPGDDVTITGIVKMQGTDNGKVKTSAVSSLYIQANCVTNNNRKAKNNEGINIELSILDYKSIKDVYINDDTLGVLVHSLCPGIYGHEMIKMALLLTLFGGSPKHTNLRDNIHILIVGDPGLGKSQMLQACSRVAPKGIYVSGNSSSSSGLTVTLVREKGESDFALEPGALVLADRGCCCIDEFDKMPTQHQALLEAMEQQSVSVAKSGVIWSLPARTSILAAANPIGGRYDKSKILAKNLNMSQPLLSRFDLIFLLLDQPDKDLDNFLSGHVMLMHTGNEPIKNEGLTGYNKPSNSLGNSLRKRLVSSSKNKVHNVSSSILRKYISYARQYVNPRLSTSSATVLQNYYLNLRRTMNVAANLAPCNRQLEALVRLTEARAKLDLREETTEQDALDIIELMEYTVLGMEDNKLNFTLQNNKESVRGAMKYFLKFLVKDSEEKQSKLFSKEELKDVALRAGFCSNDVSNAIDRLNEQGILIKTSSGMYKFIPP
ncbi:DNA helicase MCM8-like [Phymastichus coffea]|uniref:DNA helicase MCM8-like n=1 Tax=Phymastichus coffea TaxID=108790 RepID=UPI00273B9BB0|nr:DNA helicase MCM8-like [Phymastichus coffea]